MTSAPDLRFINPATIAKPPGYTHVVEVSGPGRIVYIAGQLGLGLDGKLAGAPGDFRAQAKQAFENLRNALAAVDAGFEHVVKLNNYLTNIRTHLSIYREVRDAYYRRRTLAMLGDAEPVIDGAVAAGRIDARGFA